MGKTVSLIGRAIWGKSIFAKVCISDVSLCLPASLSYTNDIKLLCVFWANRLKSVYQYLGVTLLFSILVIICLWVMLQV